MGGSFRRGAAGAGLFLALTLAPEARGQDAPASAPGATSTPGSPQENLTVLGHQRRFEAAPMPGPELPPPPDKPAPHLGRYKISGDQTQKDGYDPNTGSYVGQFGSAYMNSSPTANGLASRYAH